MTYDNRDDYYFWTWVEAYPATSWVDRLLIFLGLCPDDRQAVDARAGRGS